MGAILATALLSIIVFSLTQVLQKFIIEPYLHLKVVLADLSGFLAAYQIEIMLGNNIFVGDSQERIGERLRDFSMRLRAASVAILFYETLCKLPYPKLRSLFEINKSCGNLILLSWEMKDSAADDEEAQVVERKNLVAEISRSLRINTSFGKDGYASSGAPV